MARRKLTTKVAPHYVLCRKTGKEILVNSENAHEYRNAVNFIRLNKPVGPNTNSPLRPEQATETPPAAEKPPAKKAAAKKAAKKAPVKKKAAAKKAKK